MSLEQPGKLHRNFLTATRGPRDLGRFRHVRSHGNADAAEELYAFSDGVNQLDLFPEVLVEKQVQLIEGLAGNLPVVLLVEIPERHGIGEDLVQHLDAFCADSLLEAYRQPGDFPEFLNLRCTLMRDRPRAYSRIGLRPYWEEFFDLTRVQGAHDRRRCRDENGTEPWACSSCDCTQRLERRLVETGESFLDVLRRKVKAGSDK